MFEIRPIISALFRHKSSTLLIVLQIAITFAVVVNSFSIIQQRISLVNRDPGFSENELISFSVRSYEDNYDIEANIKADIRMLRNTPGIVDAIGLNQIPLSGSGDSSTVATTRENLDKQIFFRAGFLRSDSHLINTLDIKLLAGRNFREDEVDFNDGSLVPKVAMITSSLATRMFPNGDALGKRLFTGTRNLEVTIVGIIEKMSGFWVHWSKLDDNVILPELNSQRILIRTEKGAREEFLGSIEKLMLSRDPRRVVSQLRSMTETKQRSYKGDNAMTKILWVVVSLLVIITALGIVGIVSFNVNQRTKQIGTRRALGARRVDIQRYFILENVLISSIGLAVGTLLAVSFNVYLVNTYRITPIDWYYLPIGMITMFGMGILSVWIPAQRASGISPAVATQSI